MLKTLFTRSSQLHTLGHVQDADAVLVLPFIDMELTQRLAKVLQLRALHSGLVVLVDDDERMGFMKIANFVCAHSSSRYFGYLAQDAFPGDGWLRAALDTLDGSNAGLLAFNDGRFHGTLAIFGLARRSWLAKLYHKFVFFPGYNRHFGDTELSAIAIHQDQLIYNPGCLMIEVDYEKHAKSIDKDDAAIFDRREAQGFDGIIQQA